MADSLYCDGVDDYRRFNAGSVVGSGAITIVLIAKNIDPGTGWMNYLGWNSVDRGLYGDDTSPTQRLAIWDGGVARASTFSVMDTENWLLLAASKPAGTSTPRFHRYKYDTSAWIHEAASGTIVDYPVCANITWAADGDISQHFNGNILIAGIWDSELSDATIETLNLNKADWVTAAPKEAYRFDTAGTITPFVGTSTQTASVGGTLDSGDAPSGWSDGPATPIPLIYVPAQAAMRARSY